MSTLFVGFDSAWTAANEGALVGLRRSDDDRFYDLGAPQIVDYRKAAAVICEWQAKYLPTATIVLLDQPTIVDNAVGQRPVENIIGSPIGLRYGGMQPANRAKEKMFGKDAPIWPFLTQFGGAADPLEPVAGTRIFETYPVLAMIALGWTLPDSRKTGRLPKYNPKRGKTFSNSDWQHVCGMESGEFHDRGLMYIAEWLNDVARKSSPHKRDQDCVDACLCLLVALHLAEQKDCLLIGDQRTGYIIVPHCADLHGELDARCRHTGRMPSEWVRTFKMDSSRTRGASVGLQET